MRLDKYLKVSRLIKRRSVANEACDAGRVQINGRVANAGTEVKVGDHVVAQCVALVHRLVDQFGNKDVSVEVLDVQETVHKENAGELYKYI